MWTQSPTDMFRKRVKRWPKKYKRELGAMMANLQTVVMSLNQGAKVESLLFGFVHHEPGGVLALDQKGGGVGLKQTRLYVYPQKAQEVLHIITIGDKGSQNDDIRDAKNFVDGVRAGKERDEDTQ